MTMDLFSAVNLGSITMKNRVVMAPLTRNRAGEGGVPQSINVSYYEQRATAGLIVTEATPISNMAHGYPALPGIYTEAQIAGWKKVTDAVQLSFNYGMLDVFLTLAYYLTMHYLLHLLR